MVGKLKGEVFVMRGILGPKISTPATYGQEISMAKNVVERILKSKNTKLIEYILLVAKLKKSGNDRFIAGIGELSNEMMIKGVLQENIRRINLYINCLELKSVKELINKSRISLGVDKKCNLVN